MSAADAQLGRLSPASVTLFLQLTIADDLRARYREWLCSDLRCEEVSDLLMAEEQVVPFVHELGQGMVQDFVDVRQEQALESREPCICGRRKEALRHTFWERQTPFGPVHVRDTYTYCRFCRESERPLHAWLGTDREPWSLLTQEAAVDLAVDESCGKAVAKLKRHHPGVDMGRTTALRFLHRHGSHAREFIDAKLAEAGRLAELPACGQTGVEELEVQFDGGMIPVATLEVIPVEEGQEPELTPVRGLPKRRKVCAWEEVKAGLVQKPGETTRL